MHSYEVFGVYQRASWELSDIPWDDFQADLVRPIDIKFAKGAVVGESNSIAAQHGFFNEFPDDYDFAAFVCLWGYQELQHHLAFKKWLQLAGEEVDYSRINAMRQPYPPGITPAATLATNIISEVVTNHMYKTVSRASAEPVITKLMMRASGDEARHAREFAYYCGERLKAHPEEKSSVLETLYVYVSEKKGQYQHPVSRFKGDLPELAEGENINDVFDRFAEVDEDGVEWERVRTQLLSIFSTLVGMPLTKLADVRRAIVSV